MSAYKFVAHPICYYLGAIKDATGASIPQAKVKVINQQTGTGQDTLANETGNVRVVSLTSGSYRVEVEADGFQKLIRSPSTWKSARWSLWTWNFSWGRRAIR